MTTPAEPTAQLGQTDILLRALALEVRSCWGSGSGRIIRASKRSGSTFLYLAILGRGYMIPSLFFVFCEDDRKEGRNR